MYILRSARNLSALTDLSQSHCHTFTMVQLNKDSSAMLPTRILQVTLNCCSLHKIYKTFIMILNDKFQIMNHLTDLLLYI